MPDQPHVVILGAGFGGIGALKRLDDPNIKVTIIDKRDYHTFQPLLYQVATDELAPSEVGFPIRELLAKLLKKTPENIKFSEELQGMRDELLQVARQFQLEGLVAKRRDSSLREWPTKRRLGQSQDYPAAGVRDRRLHAA